MIPARWLPTALREAFVAAADADRFDTLRRELRGERLAPSPGSLSADGSAVAGREGWLFLHEGSNGWADQASGRMRLTPEGCERWQALLARRREWLQARGVRFAQLFVPEKACVYPELLPTAAAPVAERPLLQLVGASPAADVLHPLAALKAGKAIAQTYHRGNSHWTWWGAYLATASLLESVGLALDDALPPIACAAVQHDLAVKFDGLADEPWRRVDAAGWLVYSNEAEVAGHTGRLAQFRNPAARNACRVLVFGDSYAFDHSLAAWLAMHCREVVCSWQSGFTGAVVDRIAPDVVIGEMAERFVTRLPVDRLEG